MYRAVIIPVNSIKSLSAIGGNEVGPLLKRMLNRLMTDGVATLFNWKGKNSLKKPFSRTKMCWIIMKAVRQNRGTSLSSDECVEQKIKSWLRFAPERDGGRKRRLEKNKGEAQAPAAASTSQ
ncbi:hypothetical protein V1264_002780 [Littorina saxatilis]|uniref:DUF4806 domain-containing protein n=1 Tax=Littorina saxatilis TaxID=31220 RepID=A0AAN9B4H7_9CAEN